MYEEQVKKGAEWLDRVAPGWGNKINITYLELENAEHCSLGQLFGGIASRNLCAEFKFSVEHGFNVGVGSFREKGFFESKDSYEIEKKKYRSKNFLVLTGAWIRFILERRANRAMVDKVIKDSIPVQ